MENLGKKIEEGLYKKKMKQVDLARKMGKPPQLINDWIKGRKNPQVDDFINLSIELDIVSEFFPKQIPKKDEGEKDLVRVWEEIRTIKENLEKINNIKYIKDGITLHNSGKAKNLNISNGGSSKISINKKN